MQPCPDGSRPLKIDACEGTVHGAADQARLQAVPRAASAVRLGVSGTRSSSAGVAAVGQPAASRRTVSSTTIRTFGRWGVREHPGTSAIERSRQAQADHDERGGEGTAVGKRVAMGVSGRGSVRRYGIGGAPATAGGRATGRRRDTITAPSRATGATGGGS